MSNCDAASLIHSGNGQREPAPPPHQAEIPITTWAFISHNRNFTISSHSRRDRRNIFCVGFPSLLLWINFDSFEALLSLSLTVMCGLCGPYLGFCFCHVGWLQFEDCKTGSVEIQVTVEASGIKSACRHSRTEYLGKMSCTVKIMLFGAVVNKEAAMNVKMLEEEGILVGLERVTSMDFF